MEEIDINKEFSKLISDANIADKSYPIAGCSVLLPYGNALFEYFFKEIKEASVKCGYLPIRLPTLCPREHNMHIHQDSIYTLNNNYNSYGVASSWEVQFCRIASKLINSEKCMPLKLFAEGNAVRSGSHIALIKQLEFYNAEMAAFFYDKKAAIAELESIFATYKGVLEKFNIKTFYTEDDVSDDYSQRKLYAWFQSVQAFGSVFGGSYLGDKYQKQYGFFCNTGKRELMFHQIDVLSTLRLFTAFLDSHFYINRLIFPSPGLIPYDVYVHPDVLDDAVISVLNSSGLRFVSYSHISSGNTYDFYYASGIPVMIKKGKNEYCIVNFNKTVEKWCLSHDLGTTLRLVYNDTCDEMKRMYSIVENKINQEFNENILLKSNIDPNNKVDFLGYNENGTACYAKRRI